MNPFNLKALPTRHLDLQGGYNFRDVGGLQNQNGRLVKKGKVFRGDELHGLTNQDLETLSRIPIFSIVDFRGQSEVNNAPDRKPASLKGFYALSIDPGNIVSDPGINPATITPQEAARYMKNIYVQLVSAPAAISRYREFFELLQRPEVAPLLFHCTAGKDRTGVGAALFLSALGVDEETILSDYLLSNLYLEGKYGKLKKEHPYLKVLFEVTPDFLRTGLNTVKEKYGSVQNYLTEELNVDLSKMEKMYLE